MTSMNFTLSPELQTELKTDKAYVYALEYAAGQFVGSVNTLATPGSIPTGTVSIPLPSSFSSGQVYVLIQPNGDGKLGETISKLNSGNVNAITVETAQHYGFKYQLLEATLSNNSGDLGDISSVNTFGIPVTFSDSNGARGFAPGFVANTFTSKLPTGSVLEKAAGARGRPRAGVEPLPQPVAAGELERVRRCPGEGHQHAEGHHHRHGLRRPQADGLSGHAERVRRAVRQHGQIFRTGAQHDERRHQPRLYPHQGRPRPSAQQHLCATRSDRDLAHRKGQHLDHAADHHSQFAGWPGREILRCRLRRGLLGRDRTRAQSARPDPDRSQQDRELELQLLLRRGVQSRRDDGRHRHQRGERLFRFVGEGIQLNSNTYGWSYGDLISQGGTNPQISLWDTAKKQQVQSIDITLYSSAEKIPATSGFQGVPPSYVAPTGAAYVPVSTPINTTINNNANLISVNFTESAGSLSVNPNAQTPAFFKFYAPHDTQAGSDGFVSLSLTATGSDWSNFNVVGTPGNWKLQNFSANTAGNFNIYNMPVTSDGSTGWYQIVFGDASKGQATVYNFYAKSDSSGHFLDISSNPNNFVTDHGLGYGPGLGTAWMTGLAPGQTGYVMTLAPSGVMTYDIATLSRPGTFFGTNGDDVLNATAGDDVINGGSGNDVINGGPSTDTAISWEPSRNFALTTNAGTASTFVIKDKVGTDGTDTLNGIESVQFVDKTISLDTVTKTASLPADQILKVVDLYTAGLNRAPDAVGLSYWASKLADGARLSDVSKLFFSSSEAASIYSPTNSDTVVVQSVYQAALGRAADAGGLAYWVKELAAGHLQRTDLVTALVDGARAQAASSPDALYVANKEAVGAHFALTQGLNNVTAAMAVESGVTGAASSVTAANLQTDNFAGLAALAASSELVVQILGVVP